MTWRGGRQTDKDTKTDLTGIATAKTHETAERSCEYISILISGGMAGHKAGGR